MKKRTAQLWFYGIYCALSLIGMILDFDLLNGRFSTRPFVFYTSLSNMLCSGFVLLAFINILRTTDTDHGFAPLCKYLFTVMILVTAIVYNLLLNPYRSVIAYFAAVKSCLHHLILPLLFFVDWLVFYPRRKLSPLQPLLTLLIPLLYVVYILLRAAVVKTNGISVSVLYPYFFLNVDRLGWQGFGMWMAILLAAVLALSYGLFCIDRLLRSRKAIHC